ncbi:glycosyltransferase family 90 protein [Xylona heveae TC161]|uniref:Glycosyltransferase family 90 protein n=1 Tax=Xylona heveae (strain CBS 132557 / TC161) TaxID=1328760 RepID=A0A165GI33_XYLHT|nr:glycosyltransferase family 90 protein [Xylona heveae TC161]KZF22209.1 glycosyltransferase family 90 protein [Xylona heveae TC161]
MDYLITKAEAEFQSIRSTQSRSLTEAAAEYRRRYRIPPPPNFDKWYEFAKNKDVQLIDEYDNIHEFLLPFWSLDPSTIRARAREALGFDNSLIALLIRGGQAIKIEGGPEWQQQATLGMIQDFVQYLPDMDLAFNIHDEPRVVVPHEDLNRMVAFAKDKVLPMAFANEAPRNSFSPRPRDMNNGKRIEEVKITRFNKFAHQPTWTHSRLSCPPESPARALGEHPVDNATSYALGELGFVFNQTAFCDICTSPSFREMYGFFDRPNAFNVIHDLFPIFSQSKISSFQDILYPSPWYWFGKVAYEEDKDFDWNEKKNQLYWRGSTTGGFSRDGGWRRQHRQHLVKRINAIDEAKSIENVGGKSFPDWRVKEIKREDYKDLFNVKFSHVGQCDPGDCDAQKEFFELVPPEGQQEAWASKYLLDIDGNAFSGRFYAFLMSRSLVYKLAVFKEWHEQWIKPWVHYIPLGLIGDEWLESVRYFAQEPSGQTQAERLAMQGRDWASKTLRNEDLEAWFFRLLLEYGRLIDDDRHLVGYSTP